MSNAWDTLDRIQRVKMKRDDGSMRAEVTLHGMKDLPADVVLEATEQLRQVLQYLQITDLSVTPADDLERQEN